MNSELLELLKNFPFDTLFLNSKKEITGTIPTSQSKLSLINRADIKNGAILSDIFPKSALTFILNALDGVILTKEPKQTQFKTENNDNTRSFYSAWIFNTGSGIYICTIQDITEFKIAENNLLSKQIQVERQKAIEQLIVTYNHEINNALAIMDIAITNIKEDFQDERLNSIENAIDRVKKKIEELSTLKNKDSSDIKSEIYSSNIRMIQSNDTPKQNYENYTVLVVDEDIDFQVLIMDYLTSSGIDDIYLASSLEEALHLLSEHDINLVVTEVMFQEGTGIDLAREISRRDQIDTEIVFMSGLANIDEMEAKTLGAISFLKKPFQLEELVTLINGQKRE